MQGRDVQIVQVYDLSSVISIETADPSNNNNVITWKDGGMIDAMDGLRDFQKKKTKHCIGVWLKVCRAVKEKEKTFPRLSSTLLARIDDWNALEVWRMKDVQLVQYFLPFFPQVILSSSSRTRAPKLIPLQSSIPSYLRSLQLVPNSDIVIFI
jgi:hypothetical protein